MQWTPVSLSPRGGVVDDRFDSRRFEISHLVMLITEECNLRCDYCYIRKVPRTMSEQTAAQSVDFLFENGRSDGPLGIVFFGGEPLLEPGLIEFIHDRATARAAEAGRRATFSMTTNATLLHERNVALLRRLGVKVRISLDGIGASHDRHRRTVAGRGSFGLIERHLDRVRSLPAVSVRLTVTPETASELVQSMEWLVARGFEHIAFSPVVEADWDARSIADLVQARIGLAELERSTGVPILELTDAEQQLCGTGAQFGCGAARNFVAIDSQGHMYPCHRFIGYFRNGRAQRVGHVATGYDDARRSRYIAANHLSTHSGCGAGLFDEDEQSRECRNCGLLSECASRCMAINEHMTGDPTQPHPINRVLAQAAVSTTMHALEHCGC